MARILFCTDKIFSFTISCFQFPVNAKHTVFFFQYSDSSQNKLSQYGMEAEPGMAYYCFYYATTA